MKTQYSYKVGGVVVGTREAARAVQRSFREGSGGDTTLVPKIVQKVTTERFVR